MNQTPNQVIYGYIKSVIFTMKSFNNKIQMYSTDNVGKSVVTERFIRTLKNNLYKYITSTSKNMHIDKLDDIVNKYNSICYRTIKTKAFDVKLGTYIASST